MESALSSGPDSATPMDSEATTGSPDSSTGRRTVRITRSARAVALASVGIGSAGGSAPRW